MDARFSAGLILVFGLAVLAGVLLAQSQTQSTAAPQPTIAPSPILTPASNEINIEPNPSGKPEAIYVPSTRVVHVGHSVIWINRDSVAHSATADNGSFNTDVLNPGERKSWTPSTPGTYPYGDYENPDVRGVLIVKP